MYTTAIPSSKRRSLTPRLAALLNLDPPFGSSPYKRSRVNYRHYMAAVPVTYLRDSNSMDMDSMMNTEPEGLIRLDEGRAVFEFFNKRWYHFTKTSKEVQKVEVSLLDIEQIDFLAPKWWRWQGKICVRFKSLEIVKQFPCHIKGEIWMRVKFGLRDEAHELVNAVKLAIADAMLGKAEKEAGES